MIWKVLSAVLALVALATGATALRHLREAPPPVPPVVRSQLSVPTGVVVGSGSETLDAAISPDGGDIALVATQDGTTSLWLESLSTGTARALAGTEGAALPAWTHDGGGVVFFSQGALKALTLSTGVITVLADAPAPAGATCLEDGSVLFVAGPGVVRKLAGGVTTDVTALAPGDVSHAFPFVDDQGRLLYVAQRENGARVIRIVANGVATDLTETAGHVELRDGVLVHVRDDVLLAQRLDEGGTRLVGRSTPLATGVGHSDRGRGYFTTSRRITLWAPALPRASVLAWFDEATGVETGTATEPGDYWQVRLSPSGREAAVTTLDPLLRTLDVMVVPLAAPGNTRRLSLAIGPDTDPVWSPGGASVLYRSVQSGPGAILERPAAQSAQAEAVVLRQDVDLTPTDWRGNTVLFHSPGEGGTRVIAALDRSRGTETPVTRSGFNSWNARWSADGKWIAYSSDEAGQAEVYVQAWPSGTPRVRASFGGGQRPQWGRGGTLYFMRGDTIMRAEVTAGPIVSTPQPVVTARDLRDFAIAPTGNRLLAIVAAPASSVVDAHLILDWPGAVPPPPATTR